MSRDIGGGLVYLLGVLLAGGSHRYDHDLAGREPQRPVMGDKGHIYIQRLGRRGPDKMASAGSSSVYAGNNRAAL